MSAPRASRYPLSLPYAATGFAGGFMVADGFRLGALRLDAGTRPLVAILVPTVAAGLGHLVTRLGASATLSRRLLVAAVAVLAAGVIVGATVGVIGWSAAGLPEGAASGLYCGIAFFPAFALVLAAARRVGRARRHSLVDGSDRRGVWLAVATSVALGSFAALPEWASYPDAAPLRPDVSLWLAAGALVGIVALTLLDWDAWLRARAAAKATTTMQPRDPGSPHVVSAPTTLDLGLGELVWHHAALGVDAYKDLDRLHGVIAGCPSRGCGALRRALVRDCAALAVGIAAIALASSEGFADRAKDAYAHAFAAPVAVHVEPHRPASHALRASLARGREAAARAAR